LIASSEWLTGSSERLIAFTEHLNAITKWLITSTECLIALSKWMKHSSNCLNEPTELFTVFSEMSNGLKSTELDFGTGSAGSLRMNCGVNS